MNGVRQFSGLVDVFRKTIQTDGFRGLYRGFGIAAFGAFVYRGLYFGLYDTAKPILFKHKSSVYKSFFLGWAVVATSSLCVYPLDTIKRRMMLTSGEKIKYRNAIHCGSTILRHLIIKSIRFFKI
ncbi:ADP,ATP carrier protein [Eurytemora carolleeae]|uniref:ADP,ATP carrier protein n=1 Tax=Eurytemora carolleeae TaxID=1294199 RepID=UPI000C781844|nr:ADP,ATP carrier protein [Eurytemora carolleeae]|eukprot:XP_023348873.1 ADP,ATP carrier protein-like [Eurytemora affinis]